MSKVAALPSTPVVCKKQEVVVGNKLRSRSSSVESSSWEYYTETEPEDSDWIFFFKQMDPEPTNMCVAITVVAVSSIKKPGERKGRTLKDTSGKHSYWLLCCRPYGHIVYGIYPKEMQKMGFDENAWLLPHCLIRTDGNNGDAVVQEWRWYYCSNQTEVHDGHERWIMWYLAWLIPPNWCGTNIVDCWPRTLNDVRERLISCFREPALLMSDTWYVKILWKLSNPYEIHINDNYSINDLTGAMLCKSLKSNFAFFSSGNRHSPTHILLFFFVIILSSFTGSGKEFVRFSESPPTFGKEFFFYKSKNLLKALNI